MSTKSFQKFQNIFFGEIDSLTRIIVLNADFAVTVRQRDVIHSFADINEIRFFFHRCVEYQNSEESQLFFATFLNLILTRTRPESSQVTVIFMALLSENIVL